MASEGVERPGRAFRPGDSSGINSGFPDWVYFAHIATKSVELSGENMSIRGAPALQTSNSSGMGLPLDGAGSFGFGNPYV